MCNNNIHYDYCRCCGIWVEGCNLGLEAICTECWDKYGLNWFVHKKTCIIT